MHAAPAALPPLKGRGGGSTHRTFPFVSPLVRLEETCNPSGVIPYPRSLSKMGSHLGNAGYLILPYLQPSCPRKFFSFFLSLLDERGCFIPRMLQPTYWIYMNCL